MKIIYLGLGIIFVVMGCYYVYYAMTGCRAEPRDNTSPPIRVWPFAEGETISFIFNGREHTILAGGKTSAEINAEIKEITGSDRLQVWEEATAPPTTPPPAGPTPLPCCQRD